MATKPTGSGIFFSKPWRERPWWSRGTDIVNFSITGIVLLVVLWESVRRWLGY
jgi:hypothetical protein